MVNTWLKTVKKVNARLPKGTLLINVLKKAKEVYSKTKKVAKITRKRKKKVKQKTRKGKKKKRVKKRKITRRRKR